MPATILFKAMGMSKRDILEYFYTTEHYRLEQNNTLFWEVRKDLYRKDNAYADITAPDGNVIVRARQAHYQTRLAAHLRGGHRGH